MDVLIQLKLHEQVVIGRETGVRIGAHVTRKLSQVPYHTTLPERKVTANVALYMPTLFGLEGVITPEMLLRGPLGIEYAKPTAASAPCEETADKPASETELLSEGVRRRFTLDGKPLAETPFREQYDALIARVGKGGESNGKPSKNGKH